MHRQVIVESIQSRGLANRCKQPKRGRCFPLRSSSAVSHSFFKIFTGVWLIYNVVLVPAVQQSESVIHMLFFYTHIHFFFQFFSRIDHYRVLSSSLCYVAGPY